MTYQIKPSAICKIALAAMLLTGSAHAGPFSKKREKADPEATISQSIKTFAEETPSVDPLGIVVMNASDLPSECARIAKLKKVMGERLSVVRIEPGSLAQQLGLQVGDELVQINDYYVSRGPEGRERLETLVLPNIDWDDTVNLIVLRNGYGVSISGKADPSYTQTERASEVIPN